MWRASAVSHQIIRSEKPKPLANTTTATSATGVPSANRPFCTGHAITSSSPASSGRAGRQRRPIKAPATAPTPARLSSTPNTPAPPYTSREMIGASAYQGA
jgi:hypothetical protein